MKKILTDLATRLSRLDELDNLIFADTTNDEDSDRYIEVYNRDVEAAAKILNKVTHGKINTRTAELMARAKRNEIITLIAKMA